MNRSEEAERRTVKRRTVKRRTVNEDAERRRRTKTPPQNTTAPLAHWPGDAAMFPARMSRSIRSEKFVLPLPPPPSLRSPPLSQPAPSLQFVSRSTIASRYSRRSASHTPRLAISNRPSTSLAKPRPRAFALLQAPRPLAKPLPQLSEPSLRTPIAGEATISRLRLFPRTPSHS
jgi:hypothetical protein